jgi:hypothetical protein
MTRLNHATFAVLGRISALLTIGLATLIVVLGVKHFGRDQFKSIDEDIAQSLANRQRLQAFLLQARKIDPAMLQRDETKFRTDFLAGTQDSLIVADLQGRLRDLVTSKNTELSSARMLPARTVAEQTYLGLRMQIRGPMASIQQIVHDIEYGTPLLFLERIVLRREDYLAVAPDQNMDPVPVVFAELDVYGAKWPAQPGIAAAVVGASPGIVP